MEKIYIKLLNKEASIKENTLWYTLGSLCNSVSSVLLLMYVTRILGASEAGVFSIAYSVATLMLSVGWYGTRQYQVSDINEVYSFSNYFTLKIITSFLALIGGILYAVLLQSDLYKFIVIIFYCIFVLNDVFADLFAARFQQVDKLHISGKSYLLRIVGYNIIFLLALICFESILISISLASLYSFIELYIFDYPMIKRISSIKIDMDRKKIFSLFKECFPLFIASFLTIFIVNIPKNAIDQFFISDAQTYYNIIMMPSSIVNLFCMFIFVPQFTMVARAWNEGDKSFYLIIGKILFALLIFSIFVLFMGYFLGIPVLNVVYAVDLNKYKDAFMILLVAGCISGVNSVLSYIITVFRKQNSIIIIYVVASIFSQISIDFLINNFDFFGAALDYLFSIIIVFSLFLLIIVFYIKKGVNQ